MEEVMPLAVQAGPPEALLTQMGSHHVDAFDGFRGLAIVLVIFFHVGMVSLAGHGWVLGLFRPVQKSGWIGVEMFFTLSGFLITGVLLRSAHQAHRARNFFARRALRIFPLYFGVLVLLALAVRLERWSWNGALPALGSYTQNFRTDAAGLRLEITGPNLDIPLRHLWSLAVEEQFYLIWPLLVWASRTRRLVICLCVASIVLCPALRWWALARQIPFAPLRYWTFFHVDSLTWGGLGATVLQQGKPQAVRRLQQALLICGGSSVALVTLWEGGSLLEGSPTTVRYGFSALGAFSCGLLLLFTTSKEGLTARLFCNPVLRWCGRYSYGMYLFHYLPMEGYERLRFAVVRVTGQRLLGALTLVGAAYATSATLAYLSFHLYEKNFLRLKARF